MGKQVAVVKAVPNCMQRDVPGFTRAALPILAGQGVKAVTVGVNGGSAPPAVPHNTPFLWHDTLTQTDMLAMWHPGRLRLPGLKQDLLLHCMSHCHGALVAYSRATLLSRACILYGHTLCFTQKVAGKWCQP